MTIDTRPTRAQFEAMTREQRRELVAPKDENGERIVLCKVYIPGNKDQIPIDVPVKPPKDFNYRIYGDYIRSVMPFINKHDLRYLCNRSANIYRSLKNSCVNNYRVSRVRTFLGVECISAEYRSALEAGCCGFSDTKVTNPKTGHSFMIGFNYGH